MAGFHIAIEKPDEIVPRLGKQKLHWKKGRSAFELSTVWMRATGIPDPVRAVLDQAPEWRNATLLEGLFEHETSLPGKGRRSQTDLLAILALADSNGVLGVEGKFDEPFGLLVEEWLNQMEVPGLDFDAANLMVRQANRRSRLEGLCATLSIDPRAASHLYYQLIHRTCAAIYEAKRFRYRDAIMLVHSFDGPADPSREPACFDEFKKFALAVGLPISDPGSISAPKLCDGVNLRLAWVSDKPSV